MTWANAPSEACTRRKPLGHPPSVAASLVALLLVLVSVFAATGCRSQAYQQVYSEKMAGEIRRLEDSLYALEYENEVLRQKIDRVSQRDRENYDSVPSTNFRQRAGAGSSGDQSTDNDNRSPSGNRLPPAKPLPNRQEDFDDPLGDDLGIDLGEPMDDGLTPPTLDPGTPPPIAPIPPRQSDLVPPAIDLGEPQPPGGNNGTKPNPPGQIKLPGEVRKLFDEPETRTASSMEIYPGLSGLYHLDQDAESDGIHLVVAVKDSEGAAFDPATVLSIVVLDPAREGEDARLGRWDFEPETVSGYYKQEPVAGYHFPLAWQEKRPLANEVAVFVRVRTGVDEKIEAETYLRLSGTNSESAEWTPNPFGAQLASPGFDRERIWR